MNNTIVNWCTQLYRAEDGWYVELLNSETFGRKWFWVKCDPAVINAKLGWWDWQDYEGVKVERSDHPESGVDG